MGHPLCLTQHARAALYQVLCVLIGIGRTVVKQEQVVLAGTVTVSLGCTVHCLWHLWHGRMTAYTACDFSTFVLTWAMGTCRQCVAPCSPLLYNACKSLGAVKKRRGLGCAPLCGACVCVLFTDVAHGRDEDN